MWKKIKSWFASQPPAPAPSPEPAALAGSRGSGGGSVPSIPIIPADSPQNPYKVPLLDVQPVTQHMLSTSQDPQCAKNAISFRDEDGTCFIGMPPSEQRVTKVDLRYPVDPVLLDGAMYLPQEMEHKWALFYHGGKILFVRSWTRQVRAIADTRIENGVLTIPSISGVFADTEEPAEFTERVADYLLRTLVLEMGELAPISPALFAAPEQAALFCMSLYGRHARFATASAYTSPRPIPQPLRTYSLFHVALARGDRASVDKYLAQGVPFDLLAQDGSPPLFWSLARKEDDMLLYLLERGSPIDVCTNEGATALMQSVQARSLPRVELLLSRGADPNAVDHRGFTALHRAAEMGEIEVVKRLLEKGARTDLLAMGLSPRDLAEKREEQAIVSLLVARS
jgi:hypothetical protein